MRSLGFVDRLVSPWIQTAQRSASMRLFAQYASLGMAEREGNAVSWVFPRPWYQDELDWMAAARQAPRLQSTGGGTAPAMLTTRGTYVTPARAAAVMPSALYEYVAPSLSVAAPLGSSMVGGMGESVRGEAYSPLVSLAAVQASELMARAVAPLMMPRVIRGEAGGAAGNQGPGTGMTSAALANPALRRVLASLLARAQAPAESPISRVSQLAPELVTPPSPRAEDANVTVGGGNQAANEGAPAAQPREEQMQVLRIAQQVAEQRARVAEVSRVAHQAAQREVAARSEVARVEAAQRAEESTAATATATATGAASAAQQDAVVATARVAEAELRARTARAQVARAESVQTQQQARVESAQAIAQEQAARVEAVAQQQADRARLIEVERGRIEERIAQRVAERTGAVRLHEHARIAAAEHARSLELAPTIETAARPSSAPRAGEPRAAASQVPAAVVAAMAALPPELATYLAAQASRAPGGAMQAFSELGDALRTVELMARASSSGAAFEATRGPRLMMPAGLGGLVAGVDRAQAVADRPALLTGAGPRHFQLGEGLAATVQAHAAAAAGADRGRRLLPTVAMTHVASGAMLGGRAETSAAPTSALAAAAASPPAALAHVAWADRWLARFAGASQQSLDTLAAGSQANPALRLSALLASAPEAVFVAPTFDTERDAPRVRVDAEGRVHVTAANAPTLTPVATAYGAAASAGNLGGAAAATTPRPLDTGRVDDSAEISDDVFAAIAAAAASKRAPRNPAAAAASRVPAPPRLVHLDPDRYGAADMLAHLAPGAPGSGLSAGLASSPFASALRHVLPLAAAQSFDVRSLFGSGIASTYLAGLLDPAAHEIAIGASMPAWSGIGGLAGLGALGGLAGLGGLLGADGQVDAAALERSIPGFEATYVGPDGERADGATAALEPEVMRALQQATAAGGGTASLTTLRSALLSWQVDTGPGGVAASLTGSLLANLVGPQQAAMSAGLAPAGGARDGATSTARAMLDAMAMPLLGGGSGGGASGAAAGSASGWTSGLLGDGGAGDGATRSSRTAPGAFADRAHHFSVEQERSTADLAFDFVTPELVLAARVYGLGPAEAAQAARLALAGPGQLAAMAGAVDRTFVQAMAMDAERRAHGGPSLANVAGVAGSSASARTRETLGGGSPGGGLDLLRPDSFGGAASAGSTASPGAMAAGGALAPGGASEADLETFAAFVAPGASSFGVQRRSPRGAFLWPSATVAALHLNAAGPDGQHATSVAALELLAAQAVAELGTFTALGLDHIRDNTGELSLSDTARATLDAGGSAPGAGGDESRPAGPGRGPRPMVGAVGGAEGQEPPESDVLAAATALMPQGRRSRFEALYLALGQSAAGRDWSPAARAARALALAGRSDDGASSSARERAAMAWDVLPIVYGEFNDDQVVASSGQNGPASASGRAGRPPEMTTLAGGPRTSGRRGEVGAFDSDRPQVDVRPGLGQLSARAGEALGAYVMPAAASSGSAPAGTAAASALGAGGAIRRVPTAAQEMVQTGRAASGRFGGGEVEIPSWFESAAKRMFAERSSASDGISLSDLTLISNAPHKQIAASEIAPSKAAPISPAHHEASDQHHEPVDIESVAGDVYKHIMTMMDSARARNGEPFL